MTLFSLLDFLDENLWAYIGFPLMLFMGMYFSFKTRFVQIRKFPSVIRSFSKSLCSSNKDSCGVSPMRAFFACLGGCLGLGNLVAVCVAVQIGGPGALFWIWVVAILGMVLKYSEVYLGMRHRVPDGKGGYQGGPMYYLQKVCKTAFLPTVLAICLCIYGAEIYQFTVVTHSISSNFDWNHALVTFLFLGVVILAGVGGIDRVGKISSVIVPVFFVLYLSMGAFVLYQHLYEIPSVLATAIVSAFTGHAATGAFVGSSIMLALSQGIQRGCYTTDVGVGYASIMHSESSETVPEKQAMLTIVDVFLDTFVVVTMTILLVLVTGVWNQPIASEMMIQEALSHYFPYMNIFMPIFLFLLGYSTIIAYFFFGLKSAQYLSPKYGKAGYCIYTIAVLTFFSFVDPYQALVIMSLTQGVLLMINMYAIYRHRNEISFDFDQEERQEKEPSLQPAQN